MATLTALLFPTVGGASNSLDRIHGLERQHLIKVHDAALIYWPVGHKSPGTRQLDDLVGEGAVTGMCLGALIGAVFLAPLLGMAVGTAVGALGGAVRDHGIDTDFIEQVRGQVKEGTSALFLMTSEAVIDRVVETMKGEKFEIIATNLSKEQEQKLREAFGRK